MTETQRDAISPAATGLMIYQTDGTAGFYYFNGSGWATLGSATSASYSIGDFVNGGVVFHIFQSDEPGFVSGKIHGLVVAMSDYEADVEWGCLYYDLPSVPNVPCNGSNPIGLGAEIGDGVRNMNAILNDCPTAPAALAARSLGTDWFLPSINELKKNDNKATLEGVSVFIAFSDYYWSSTELGNADAWGHYFVNGDQVFSLKNFTVIVRAVRAF